MHDLILVLLSVLSSAALLSGGFYIGWTLRGTPTQDSQTQVAQKKVRWNPANLMDPITSDTQQTSREEMMRKLRRIQEGDD